MRAIILTALVMLAAGNAHAQEAAIAADAATTAIGLSHGFVEANPIGLVGIPLRLAATQYARTLPEQEGQPILDAVDSASWGAAAANLLTLAGAGPAGLVVGVVIAGKLWADGAEKREFLIACAVHRQVIPEAAALPCVYQKEAAQ